MDPEQRPKVLSPRAGYQEQGRKWQLGRTQLEGLSLALGQVKQMTRKGQRFRGADQGSLQVSCQKAQTARER